MNLVCNLELSKRLKELGVKQQSLFYWNRYSKEYELHSWGNVSDGTFQDVVSAFTVDELGEMLPSSISIDDFYKDMNLRIEKK